MKMAALAEKARALLMGPLAPLPYVRIEGCQVLGQQGAPILKLYLWVETAPSHPVIRELRVELRAPHKDSACVELRARRDEAVVLSLPLDTGGISPRLTVLAHLTQPLPNPSGEVAGRVAATVGPGAPVRWTRFQCSYRWDMQRRPEEGEDAAPVEEAMAQPEGIPATDGESQQAEAVDA